MFNRRVFSTIFAAIVVSVLVFGATGNAPIIFVSAQEQTGGTTVRDSTAILLAGEAIPGGSFIHLYDSTPDAIATGHVAAKIPCNENSNATLTILTGSAPNVQPTELELIPELSTPGELCLYHADLASVQGGNLTTDIAIQNPGEDEIELPATSTVVIGVNKILPGAASEEHGQESGQAGNMTQ
jgi:hypothetical protein